MKCEISLVLILVIGRERVKRYCIVRTCILEVFYINAICFVVSPCKLINCP